MANKVVVAGGGASGLIAAVFAAENGAEVTILEHKDRVGKKILMTGNGRCNLTNMSDVHGKYYSSDDVSLEKIYDTLVRFDAAKTRAFFQKLGLYTKEKRDGGIYPVSEQAAIVLDVLRSECARLEVKTITDCALTAVEPDRHGGSLRLVHYIRQAEEQKKLTAANKKDKAKNKKSEIISEKKETMRYDRLILATGGKAAPASGSDGSGYRLAKMLGHSIIEPLPALVQLKCSGDYFKAVSGVRAQSDLTLYIDGKPAAAETGELQLTDYGISGIPVFQFSRLASRALYCGRKCEVGINFISCLSEPEQEFSDALMKRHSEKPVEELLAGLVHKKLAAVVCKKEGIAFGTTVSQAGLQKVCGCIRLLSDFRVQVTEANSFENAQVCCGGVPLSEVDKEFQSLRCSNVYIVGELLDCDGICGGYNLQWAWATGAIAGTSAAIKK
ncbi:MAG: aminoacetone oxidase family FAD-binding enzyme [Lachnospiraceae bacterium]|nr:aminoacetone oxidase family FAD-binding enzyme [Lachnospiraceae bacterium]